MDWLHKILTFLTNPLTLGLAGLLVVSSWSLVVRKKERKVKGLGQGQQRNVNIHCSRRSFASLRLFRPSVSIAPLTFTCSLFAIAWLWLWSTPLMTRWIGLPLESPYPPIAAENYPEADAICLLGGGMGYWEREVKKLGEGEQWNDSFSKKGESTNVHLDPSPSPSCPEMWLSADRVWMAAKLWKAGKAKVITITGNDAWKSTMPLLQDFGVPTNAVRCITGAKNTEDEAALIAEAMREVKGKGDGEQWNDSFSKKGESTNVHLDPSPSPSCPEMWLSADRVWMAAKLWKAGKAKVITITGNDAWKSTMPLLQDFGVPTNAVVLIEDAKNTEDEAALIAEAMREVKGKGDGEQWNPTTVHLGPSPSPKILLVTSAWHIRRAEWLFKKAGLDVIPAACDYEVSARCAGKKIGVGDFLPEAEVLFRNSYLWKEWFAYWCYRVREFVR